MTAAVSKRCTRCGAVKPLAVFQRRLASADGHASHCKHCRRESVRRSRTENDRRWSRARGRALRQLAKRHPEEFRELLDQARLEEDYEAIDRTLTARRGELR